ncbi:MAG: rod shape-determining protein MreD [Alistipes sp.]|nr:rod shape-determining protein MreD [Alistipes sp.]
MQKNLIYAGAFITLVLLQVFLIDNISLSVYFHPLIYVAFIILLPLDTKPIWMVGLSALLGLTIDVMTGMGGLNVIATTATGFLRSFVVKMVTGHALGTDASDSSLHRIPEKNFRWYIIAMVVLHSLIYFTMESLSLLHIFHTLLRLVVSDIAAILFIYYFVKLFIEKILTR